MDCKLSQPHFEASVRMKFTLPKVGTCSPSGVPKTQSLIVGSKHFALRCFLCRWKGLEVKMSKMALYEPFQNLKHKLWSKEGPGVKLAVWLSTTKSRELTRPRCVQVECNTLLESFWREIQVCFRCHSNWRSELGVMNFQIPKSPN
jgi:hypothetical protein